MKTFRLFFKKKNDSVRAVSCHHTEIRAPDFEAACEVAKDVATQNAWRVVMVAELPK